MDYIVGSKESQKDGSNDLQYLALDTKFSVRASHIITVNMSTDERDERDVHYW